jgi:NAD(P)-dependent dehydrogenase (short-subunit alcohol dehydrogenase family)
MVTQGTGGVIVNISSTMGLIAHAAGYTHYVSSKHGLVGLTKALALELGPRGIRALAVCPTITNSDGYIESCRAAGIPSEPPQEELARHPLGRIAEPDDVARVVLFAVSDLAALVTGSAIAVDAGLFTT